MRDDSCTCSYLNRLRYDFEIQRSEASGQRAVSLRANYRQTTNQIKKPPLAKRSTERNRNMEHQSNAPESKSVSALKAQLRKIEQAVVKENERHSKRLAELASESETVKSDIRTLLKAELESI